jgi:hypothetical protein
MSAVPGAHQIRGEGVAADTRAGPLPRAPKGRRARRGRRCQYLATGSGSAGADVQEGAREGGYRTGGAGRGRRGVCRGGHGSSMKTISATFQEPAYVRCRTPKPRGAPGRRDRCSGRFQTLRPGCSPPCLRSPRAVHPHRWTSSSRIVVIPSSNGASCRRGWRRNPQPRLRRG